MKTVVGGLDLSRTRLSQCDVRLSLEALPHHQEAVSVTFASHVWINALEGVKTGSHGLWGISVPMTATAEKTEKDFCRHL